MTYFLKFINFSGYMLGGNLIDLGIKIEEMIEIHQLFK